MQVTHVKQQLWICCDCNRNMFHKSDPKAVIFHPLIKLAISMINVTVPGGQPSWHCSPDTPGGQRQLPVTGSHDPPFWHEHSLLQPSPYVPCHNTALNIRMSQFKTISQYHIHTHCNVLLNKCNLSFYMKGSRGADKMSTSFSWGLDSRVAILGLLICWILKQISCHNKRLLVWYKLLVSC